MSTEFEKKFVDLVVQGVKKELATLYMPDAEVNELEILHVKEPVYVSFIGYSGEHITGNLFLICKDPFVKATYPDNLKFDEAVKHDWAGELVNRLLGAVKRELNNFDVEISVTIPALVETEKIQPINSKFSKAIKLSLENGNHKAYLCLFNKVIKEFDFNSPIQGNISESGSLMEF